MSKINWSTDKTGRLKTSVLHNCRTPTPRCCLYNKCLLKNGLKDFLFCAAVESDSSQLRMLCNILFFLSPSVFQCPRCMQCDTKFDFIRRKVCFVSQHDRDNKSQLWLSHQKKGHMHVETEESEAVIHEIIIFFPLLGFCLCILAWRHTEGSVLTFLFLT